MHLNSYIFCCKPAASCTAFILSQLVRTFMTEICQAKNRM